MKCDQCQMLSINGVACHETGCPNSRKTWDGERGEWIRFIECFECGCDVEEGTVCGCDEQSDLDEPSEDTQEDEEMDEVTEMNCDRITAFE